MDILKKLYEWFVYSSQDPMKLSLTLKSLAAFAVLFGVDASVSDEGIGHVVNLVVAVGMLFSACSGAAGFARKIYLTFHK